ncbi:hypothetical protein DFH09DRAFT_1214141 [Mycena vulgaris]|nr:hypothetical protein DFH09DRAFT_1214141 [Mycena vulgaris]
MSLSIDGTPVLSFAFARIPHTLVSPALSSRVPPRRDSVYLFTVSASGYEPFSFSVKCSSSSFYPYDVVLGLDWAAYFRDSLLYTGMCLPASFDPWPSLPYSTGSPFTSGFYPVTLPKLMSNLCTGHESRVPAETESMASSSSSARPSSLSLTASWNHHIETSSILYSTLLFDSGPIAATRPYYSTFVFSVLYCTSL